MCIASIGKIIKLGSDNAEVDFGGVKRSASAALKPQAKKGDYVIVHAGFIMEIVEEKEAKERMALLKETGLN
ncbi:hydrogenase expression/formation protein HypC [Elusimicrobium posterum]|uniref:HypC/HybG/HupF family hydrogenase formation chaperone n=1 Tax=Elusimicrobium posterum TaxID=3116653 RepID=UPI003C726214